MSYHTNFKFVPYFCFQNERYEEKSNFEGNILNCFEITQNNKARTTLLSCDSHVICYTFSAETEIYENI